MSNKYQFDFNTEDLNDSEYYKTRELLLSIISNRLNILKSDLLDTNIIKSKMKSYINRDKMMMGSSGSADKDQTNDCKKLLISIMMEQYGITDEDLHSMSIVKSKLRDVKIAEILA